eukprot:2418004-Rhodomonas_salina.1
MTRAESGFGIRYPATVSCYGILLPPRRAPPVPHSYAPTRERVRFGGGPNPASEFGFGIRNSELACE